MMEVFLGGLIVGLACGWFFGKYKLERKVEVLESLLLEQDKVVQIQSVYIDQIDKKADNMVWDIEEQIHMNILIIERKNDELCQKNHQKARKTHQLESERR